MYAPWAVLSGIVLGVGGVLVGQWLSDRWDPAQPTTIIMQAADSIPGHWDKTVVFSRNRKDVYVSALFDNGLDFVNNGSTLTRQQVRDTVEKLKEQGWVERDPDMWGSHYGL